MEKIPTLNFDTSEKPEFKSDLERKDTMLGLMMKLPSNFFELTKTNKITLPTFEELINSTSYEEAFGEDYWISKYMGGYFIGPLNGLHETIQGKCLPLDLEEIWVLVGVRHPHTRKINRGLFDGKFLYPPTSGVQNTPYLASTEWLPWINIQPGFIKSKILGWIGYSYVSMSKQPEQNHFVVTWNHHRFDGCEQNLIKKVKGFFSYSGAAFRWAIGISKVDKEYDQFLRDYGSASSEYNKK